MAGIELPVLAMEHMYIVTEDIPEVVAFGRELLPTTDYSGEIYLRQEGKGVLMGTYEQDCRVWSADVTPWDFSMQLLPDDLDRLSSHLEIGFKHFPNFCRRHESTDWHHATTKCFGQTQNIRNNTLVLAGKHASSAAHTAQLAETVWFKLSGET